jgi:hypothetical protein
MMDATHLKTHFQAWFHPMGTVNTPPSLSKDHAFGAWPESGLTAGLDTILDFQFGLTQQ